MAETSIGLRPSAGAPAPPRPALLELLYAYQDTLEFVRELPPVLWVRPGRGRISGRLRVPRVRLFLRYFLAVDMHRVLRATRRCYHTRAALGRSAESDAAEATAVEEFDKSIPAVPKPRTIVLALLVIGLLLTLLAVRLILHDVHTTRPIGRLTQAVLLLDRKGLLDALKSFDDTSAPVGVFGLSVALWILLVAPVTSFRLKRELYNRRPATPAQLRTGAANDYMRVSEGVYSLERRVFELLGGFRPSEMPFDLIANALIMVPLVVAGVMLDVFAVQMARDGDDPLAAFLIAAFAALVMLAPLGRLLWGRRVRIARTHGVRERPDPTEPYASFRRRAVAYLIDFALIAALVLAAAGVAVDRIGDSGLTLLVLFAAPLAGSLLLIAASYTFPGPRRGESLGKRFVGLRVVVWNDATGCDERITPLRRIMRECVLKWLFLTSVSFMLAFLPTMVSLLRPLWDRQRQTLHDEIAGTRVVRG